MSDNIDVSGDDLTLTTNEMATRTTPPSRARIGNGPMNTSSEIK